MGIESCDGFSHGIFITHVKVAIAVVTHKNECVLPGAGIAVVGIVDYLVHHDFCIGFGRGRYASDGQIEFVSAHGIIAFAVVEESEESVVNIGIHFVERVFRFEAEQIIVNGGIAEVGGKHSVVPCAVAEEEQIAWQIGISLSAVVEHFHVSAVGVGIGCAAGKFIVEFVGRHYVHAESVALLMQCGQPLCLCEQFL